MKLFDGATAGQSLPGWALRKVKAIFLAPLEDCLTALANDPALDVKPPFDRSENLPYTTPAITNRLVVLGTMLKGLHVLVEKQDYEKIAERCMEI